MRELAMLCKGRTGLAFGLFTSLFLVACSDSKADLTLSLYRINSDCPGASTGGEISLTKDSPNVFRASGATSFGFPDDLIYREDQGLLQSTGADRACRTRAYGNEPDLLFVCFAVPSGSPECSILLNR